ncbi:MAG: hypothetical protein ACPHYE_01220 [Henriciella sp.]
MANYQPALACIGFSYHRLVRFKAELLAFRRLRGSLNSPLIRRGCPGQERGVTCANNVRFAVIIAAMAIAGRRGRTGACPPVSRFGVYLT